MEVEIQRRTENKNGESLIASICAALSKLRGRIHFNPSNWILAFLVFFLLAPIYSIAYALIFENPQGSTLPFFSDLMRYYGTTENHKQIWGVLAPLLLAVSVGASIEKGISTKSAILFFIFFVGFMFADYTLAKLSSEEDLSRVLSSRDKINVDNLMKYCESVSNMSVAAISIVFGLAATKMRDRAQQS